MKKNLIVSIVSSSLLLALAAGCSNGNTAQTPAGAKSDSPSSSKPKDKPVLTFWQWDMDKMNKDGYAVKTIEDKFGVKVELLGRTQDTYKQTLQLKIASGEIPDYWNDLGFPDYDKLVSQGVVAELPISLLEKYAPKYMTWLKGHLGDDPFKLYMRNGKNYSMPIISTLGMNSKVVGIRQDWLEKVGIAKNPETLADVETVLRKFRNEDPDGNGKKDTYGWTGKAEVTTDIFPSVFGAFGIYAGIFTEENGKVVRGEIDPRAKDALTLLNKWYKEELIDPEFVVNKSNNIEDKIISEKAGVLQAAWYELTPREAFTNGRYNNKLVEKNPKAKWTMIAGPKGPDGKMGTVQSNPIVSSGTQFGKTMEKDQEKLIKYIEVAEATSFDPDMYAQFTLGVKGKTYDIKDGDYVRIPPYDKEEEQIKFGIGRIYNFPGSYNDYEFQKPFVTPSKYREIRKQAESTGVGKYDILQAVQMQAYNENYEKLQQFTTKNFVDFITGRRPLDQFDKFVDEWNKMGGAKVMEEAQKKYDEVLKKK